MLIKLNKIRLADPIECLNIDYNVVKPAPKNHAKPRTKINYTKYLVNGLMNHRRAFSKPAELKERLYKEQKGICRACNKPLTISAELDHFYPYSMGGVSEWSNAQLLHRECNRNKSDRIPSDREIKSFLEFKNLL